MIDFAALVSAAKDSLLVSVGSVMLVLIGLFAAFVLVNMVLLMIKRAAWSDQNWSDFYYERDNPDAERRSR